MIKYVLLLSGGLNNRYNYARYACDLGYAKQVFEGMWGKDKCVFHVMYADGKPIEYLGSKLPTEIADRESLIKRLSTWGNEITPEDELYVVISNHGGVDRGKGVVYLWGKEYINLEELVDLTNQIRCHKYLILGQCFAGNILNLKIQDTLVLTANEADKESYARIYKERIKVGSCQYEYQYDEFLYHFLSGLNGGYPSGRELNGDRKRCMQLEEAYEYARENDIWNPKHPEYVALCARIERNDISEVPQMRLFA